MKEKTKCSDEWPCIKLWLLYSVSIKGTVTGPILVKVFLDYLEEDLDHRLIKCLSCSK